MSCHSEHWYTVPTGPYSAIMVKYRTRKNYTDGAYLGQGLTLAHFRDQVEDLRNTSLTLQLNLSTFGTHPQVNVGQMRDKVSSR